MKKLLRLRLRRRAIVTLKTGDSFSGILYDADSEAIVLREAEALGMGEKRTNLVVDGEVLILRGDVAYVQLP